MYNNRIRCEPRTRLQSETSCQRPAPAASQQKLWDTSEKSSPALQTITAVFYFFHFIEARRLEEREEKRI